MTTFQKLPKITNFITPTYANGFLRGRGFYLVVTQNENENLDKIQFIGNENNEAFLTEGNALQAFFNSL